MSKRLIIFGLIAALPFLIIIGVNEIPYNAPSTHKYVPDRCTWHCHDVTCRHWKTSYAEEPSQMKALHRAVFSWYVESLHDNWLGLNYGAINFLVFLIGYPLVGGWLLWRLLNKLL